MRIDDFTNWTPNKCKQKIHEYQQTKDKDLFSLILAKYDRYLVKLSWEFWERIRWEELEDIYHTAIIGFGAAIAKFKVQVPSDFIIPVIKAYVKREIEKTYITKKSGERKGYKPEDVEDLRFDFEDRSSDGIDLSFILNELVPPEEKELILLRFEENMSLKEIGSRIGLSQSRVSEKIKMVLEKISKKSMEDGLD
jgi:RNA polymerase sigma factor (sigma-70 family)